MDSVTTTSIKVWSMLIERENLKMIYLVQPSGKATVSSKCPDLLKVPCAECTVPTSTAFTDDDMALDLMRGIFR